MKKNNTIAVLATLAVLVSSAASAVEVDGIVAQVGDVTILKSDVVTAMRRMGVPEGKENFEKARNDLIDRTLILKAAGKSKMTMQEWVVDDRVRSIIDDVFGGDRNRLISELSREKVSYQDWRRRIKDDLIVNAMRWNFVNKNVKVSPSAMMAEYKAHPERYRSGESVTVGVILLDPESVSRKDEVGEMIRTNSFAAAARKFSRDTHAKEGGVWKDVDPKTVFKKDICDEISRMAAGEVSDWIDIDGWSFLLRKEGSKSASARSFADAYDDIDRNVRMAETKRLTEEWLDRLRAETYIKVY